MKDSRCPTRILSLQWFWSLARCPRHRGRISQYSLGGTVSLVAPRTGSLKKARGRRTFPRSETSLEVPWPLRFRAELSFPVGQKERWGGGTGDRAAVPKSCCVPPPPPESPRNFAYVSGLLGLLSLRCSNPEKKKSVSHMPGWCSDLLIPCVPTRSCVRAAPRLAVTSLQKPDYPRASEHPSLSLASATVTVPPRALRSP